MHGRPLPGSFDKGETPGQSGASALCPSADGKDAPDTVTETRSRTFPPLGVDPERHIHHFTPDALKPLLCLAGSGRPGPRPSVPPEPSDHRSRGRLLRLSAGAGKWLRGGFTHLPKHHFRSFLKPVSRKRHRTLLRNCNKTPIINKSGEKVEMKASDSPGRLRSSGSNILMSEIHFLFSFFLSCIRSMENAARFRASTC